MSRIVRFLTFGTIVAGCAAAGLAQTAPQNITVTVLPATTVEERVANEIKEKQLRKAAEEKLAEEESVRIAATNPKFLLSRARTVYVYSGTSFFEGVQLENELRKQEEIDAWQMAITEKGNIADIHIDIDRPLFTYTFTYKVTHRSTGIILATGKVTAFDGNAAAPKLADRIIEEIRNAKGEVKPKK